MSDYDLVNELRDCIDVAVDRGLGVKEITAALNFVIDEVTADPEIPDSAA